MRIARNGKAALVVAATTLPALALLAGGAAGATGTTGSQANSPQVNAAYAVSQGVRFPTNKQNEPTIARNPVTGAFVAGSNDEQRQPACGPGGMRATTALPSDCSFFPGVGTTPIYTSANGRSWTNRGLLPGFSDPVGSAQLASGETARTDLISDGDPVLAYGPTWRAGTFSKTSYTAYYASLASYVAGQQQGQQIPELLTVSRSTDDGLSWSAPVVAADGHGTLFNDKESLWADRNPVSPYFGRLYMTWTQFRGAGAEPINVVFSKNGGRTWSNPNQLSSAYNNGKQGGRQGSVVRTGQDGAVYVAWEDSINGQSVQVIAVSRDGGVTFSKPKVVGTVTDLADPIPGSNFRTSSFPTLAVQQAKAPYGIHVGWTNRNGIDSDVVVASGTSALTTWTRRTVSTSAEGYDFFPALDVAPNGRVDLGWQAQQQPSPTTYGTGTARVASWYAALPVGGRWSAPVRVSALSDPAASAQNNLARQFWGDYNTMTSSNNRADFIYTDARNGSGCPAVDSYQHALDAGTTASKPAPGRDCAATFGDTDIYVSTVTY
ncbi:MAG: glycoside hydrolase [Actinobacteria bacterium]|nr:glycoside hydrolase [Actinomycetota bacterium]